MESTSYLRNHLSTGTPKGKKPPSKWLSRGEKTADPELQFEVDELILDYLLHNAIGSVLGEFGDHTRGVPFTTTSDRHVNMVDSFTTTFKTLHPGQKPSPQCLLRLALLKTITLISKRFEPSPATSSPASLAQLRANNAKRADAWRSHRPGRDSSQFEASMDRQWQVSIDQRTASSESRRHFLQNYHSKISPTHSLSDGISLLDMLPEFMALSAKVFQNNGARPLAASWTELAAELCVVSTLEQYLVFGIVEGRPRQEAFAWGHDLSKTGRPSDDLRAVDEMFALFRTLDSVDWDTAREHALSLFDDRSRGDVNSVLSSLAQRFPLYKLEGKLLSFFTRVWRDVEPPILAQLDSGQLIGLSKEETRDMLQRVDWNHYKQTSR